MVCKIKIKIILNLFYLELLFLIFLKHGSFKKRKVLYEIRCFYKYMNFKIQKKVGYF